MKRVNNTPRMKSGKLNGRMLHEIGFGNFQIFDKININTGTMYYTFRLAVFDGW